MTKSIDDLIRASSLGEGLSWVSFGKHVRELRLRFRLSADFVCRDSNLARIRLLLIEAGAPPQATRDEVRAIARAIGVSPDSLLSRMP